MLADPPGSVLYNYITNGTLERVGTGSVTEGIYIYMDVCMDVRMDVWMNG